MSRARKLKLNIVLESQTRVYLITQKIRTQFYHIDEHVLKCATSNYFYKLSKLTISFHSIPFIIRPTKMVELYELCVAKGRLWSVQATVRAHVSHAPVSVLPFK